MKTTILVYLMVTCFVETRGQSVFSNMTNSALERVIQDYPNQFSNIKGSVVSETTRSTNFESNVKIPGSLSCTISQTNYTDKKLLSWKAELFAISTFSEATTKYADLFKQITNSVIRIQGTKTYILSGQYCSPDQNKNYQSTILSLLPASGELRNVKVEISLESQSGKWKILLSIFDDRDEQLARNK